MTSYEDFISEMVEDFSDNLGSKWSPDERELAERLIVDSCTGYGFEDGYNRLTDVDEDHFDKQELSDFLKEVEDQARYALRLHDLI